MKILIVEDSFVTREMLKDMLKEFGECTIAVNGEEAIYAYQSALEMKKPFELVCLDILMPVMDGQQVLRRIREIEKIARKNFKNEAKVIMITACDDPKTVVDSYYRGGAASYLVKPFDQRMVRKEVEKLFPDAESLVGQEVPSEDAA